MEFLKLDYIRQHSRLCSNEEDALLTEYANSAEWIIANWLNRGGTPQSTVASLMEEYGCVPEPILEAGQLLVDNSYLHRSPTETTNLSDVPYGTIDFKLEPYRILIGSPDAVDRAYVPVPLGSDAKVEFSVDIPDGLTIDDVDFTGIVRSLGESKASVPFAKSDCLRTETGSYVVLVDTDKLGTGIIMLRLTLQIPDTDFPAGFRRAVVDINPYIRITQ